MAQHILRQLWKAIAMLNPNDVRRLAEQRVTIGLHGAPEALDQMEEWLCPPLLSRERRIEAFAHVFRAGDADAPAAVDIEFYAEGMPHPRGAFVFYPETPVRTVGEILEAKPELALALARLFPGFRAPVAERIIHSVSKENALFALVTALPDVVPSILLLPWAAGQFASDTAFLTANQLRMAFMLAAACDRTVGYREQRSEIGAMIAGAFGWRALARELAGKLPFGSGLIPKAAIAYAATYVIGHGLDRLYRQGYAYSRAERQSVFEGALEKGKRAAAELLQSLGHGQAAG